MLNASLQIMPSPLAPNQMGTAVCTIVNDETWDERVMPMYELSSQDFMLFGVVRNVTIPAKGSVEVKYPIMPMHGADNGQMKVELQNYKGRAVAIAFAKLDVQAQTKITGIPPCL